MAMTDWRSDKRRRYTETFKRKVVAEASVAGVSASAVARRHGLNANLVFNWRRRFGGDPPVSFVPAVIVPEETVGKPTDRDQSGLSEPSPGRLEIICHGGRGIVVAGDFDVGVLMRLLAVVEDR